MATISSQSTRSSGRAQSYAKKGPVAISAIGAPVRRFEETLQEIRAAHGKDGTRAKIAVDENGKIVRDENGKPVVATNNAGQPLREAKYVQAYSLVESFSLDELDPSDPQSWVKAQEMGRAIAEDRAPGHPALIATEVNGRSGLVHNHIIIGATHPETGKQIDSNVFTHSRLAVAHDRLLEEHGLAQREEMRQMTRNAEQKMQIRREEVAASKGFDELSPSQQQRKLTAAENSVRVESTNTKSASTQRQERRQREFERYLLNEEEREAARGIGIDPEPERFSEIVLESRINEILRDPRATSWSELVEIGRDNGVVIGRRGQDVTYGMMLADADGEFTAEPTKAHTRRGKGLGEGFRLEDVERAVEHNAEAYEETAAERSRLDAEVDQQFAQQAVDQRARIEAVKAANEQRLADLNAAYQTERAEAVAKMDERRAEREAEDARHDQERLEILDNPPERFQELSPEELAAQVDELVVVEARHFPGLPESYREADHSRMYRNGLSIDEVRYLGTVWSDLDRPETASERPVLETEAETTAATPVAAEEPIVVEEPELLTPEPASAPSVRRDSPSFRELLAEHKAASAETDTSPLERHHSRTRDDQVDEEHQAEADVAETPAVEQEPASTPQQVHEATEEDELDEDGEGQGSGEGQDGQPEEQLDVAEPEPFRSRLRGLRSTSGPMQQRLTGLAELEERWGGRLPKTDEERVQFERQVSEIGVGERVLSRTEPHMLPEFHEELSLRAEKANLRKDVLEKKVQPLRRDVERLEERNLFADRDKLTDLRSDLDFEQRRHDRLNDELKHGVYEKNTPAAQAEHEERKRRVIARGEASQGAQTDELKAERNEMREINQDAAQRTKVTDNSYGIGD